MSGRPLVAWGVEAACGSDLENVVVVCQEKLLPYLPSNSKLKTVINPKPQEGQSSSLRLGLQALSTEASHILFLLADQPLITSTLINRFVGMAKEGISLACLSAGDYMGPPALFGDVWFRELSQMKGDLGARKILMAHKEQLELVPAQFKGQAHDMDRPQDAETVKRLLRYIEKSDHDLHLNMTVL
jgi:molybdenum cofactor cytidylyltransferase